MYIVSSCLNSPSDAFFVATGSGTISDAGIASGMDDFGEQSSECQFVTNYYGGQVGAGADSRANSEFDLESFLGRLLLLIAFA